MLIPCLFFLVVAVCRLSPAQDVPQYAATFRSKPVLIFAAAQTHMPTRHGDVPHLNQQEQVPMPQQQTKPAPVRLQREAQELLELSQSLQPDIESVNHGILPKDTIEKLRHIEKVAKHLRGELTP
jgi:hypothetical protein